MGTTKTEHFTDKQNATASMLKALGHPARIAIMEFLITANHCICGDIVNEIPLSQPTISQHLKELKNAGLIKGRVEGNAICYCVNEQSISDIIGYFGNITNKINQRAGNCC